MNYQLELLVDDDFDASNLRGITFISKNKKESLTWNMSKII